MKLKLNTDRLVQLSVTGEINHPTLKKTGYVIDTHGQAKVFPSVGGITYNVRIGDPATGWMADHVEPGVSIFNPGKSFGEYSPNSALNILACIGNVAQVLNGDAKGEKGFVTGKHGGIDHVLVDFDPEILGKMSIGDKILIKTFGVGLQFVDFYPEILVMNIEPQLLQNLNIQVDDYLKIGVTHQIPAKIMGSGIGSSSAYSGDYDIQIFDKKAIDTYRLNDLKLGDIVAMMDSDASHGWVYRDGAISIGVVAHSNSVISGHGPGVTTIMTSPNGKIIPFIDPDANIANYLYRKS